MSFWFVYEVVKVLPYTSEAARLSLVVKSPIYNNRQLIIVTGLLFGLAAGIVGGVNAVTSATLVGEIGEKIISYIALLGVAVLALGAVGEGLGPDDHGHVRVPSVGVTGGDGIGRRAAGAVLRDLTGVFSDRGVAELGPCGVELGDAVLGCGERTGLRSEQVAVLAGSRLECLVHLCDGQLALLLEQLLGGVGGVALGSMDVEQPLELGSQVVHG